MIRPISFTANLDINLCGVENKDKVKQDFSRATAGFTDYTMEVNEYPAHGICSFEMKKEGRLPFEKARFKFEKEDLEQKPEKLVRIFNFIKANLDKNIELENAFRKGEPGEVLDIIEFSHSDNIEKATAGVRQYFWTQG